MLSNSDLVELIAFRRDLHRRPEISGEEVETAKTVVAALRDLSPTRILTGLGGQGVAAVFDSTVAGPTVLFRAELDALPIPELTAVPWKSEVAGKGHLCGHDGHMTMLLALGRLIARTPVTKGRVVLMFQPAEEDGSGARAVVADTAFAQITPDWAFAIHNEPAKPFGHVSTRVGLINCASQGLAIHSTGKTAHAAEPDMGRSPALAMSTLIPALGGLGTGATLDENFRLVTVTHAHLGEPTFGIAPSEGVIYVTLRAAEDAAMAEMVGAARSLATAAATAERLKVTFSEHDIFAASINNAEATALAQKAISAISVSQNEDGLPMRASEDFGVFGWSAKAAMLFLGSGVDHASLHNPDFDFPDDLIPIGAAIFDRIARDILG